MAVEFLDMNLSGVYPVDNGDEVYLLPGVTLTGTGDAFTLNSTNLTSDARYEVFVGGNVIVADDFINRSMTATTGSDVSVEVNVVFGASSQVFVAGDAILLSAGDEDISSAILSFTNAGYISLGETLLLASNFERVTFSNTGVVEQSFPDSQSASALFLNVGSGITSIFNSGSMSASLGSEIVNTTLTLGASLFVENIGTMRTEGGNVNAFNLAGSTAELFNLVNSGTIFGSIQAFMETRVINSGDFHGDMNVAAEMTVRNTGSIFGTVRSQSAFLSNDLFVNSGLITGDVIMNKGEDTLRNLGTIGGSVEGGDNNDTVINSGIIEGDVYLGSDNDIFRGFGGTVLGVIDGESGNDTFFIDQSDAVIMGGSGIDTIYAESDVLNATGVEQIVLRGSDDLTAIGDDETLVMIGNNGNNELVNGDAASMINARGGDDVVNAGGGFDTIYGGTGNDVLDGEGGNDEIRGGAGDDIIIGGNGTDRMFGNQGADTFVFTFIGDTATGSLRDTIVDFERGRDIIDLSAINNDAFNFIGTSAFSGSGEMELRFRVAGTVGTRLDLDVDGDGVVDGQIFLIGVLGVDAADFVL